MNEIRIKINNQKIEAFCRKWLVSELALFGSVMTDAFGTASDIDLLVTFQPDASPSLFDLAKMKAELELILSHKVDLVSRRGLESSRNHIRRQSILDSAKVIYAA